MASAPRDAGHIDNGAVLGEINEREGVYFRVDGEEEANSIGGVSNDLTSVEDDLKSKFIRGGGELDLDVSGVASTTGGEGKLQRADTGEGQGVRKGVDIFTAVDDEDEVIVRSLMKPKFLPCGLAFLTRVAGFPRFQKLHTTRKQCKFGAYIHGMRLNSDLLLPEGGWVYPCCGMGVPRVS